MEISINTISIYIAILLTGLSAGFFYAWQVSVIPGTRQISDYSYLESMQAINRAILNPMFFIIFFGCLVVLLISSVVHFRIEAYDLFGWILAATLIYAIGTFGITVIGNVPLNETLDKIDLLALDHTQLKRMREGYEIKWNRWHTIRTVCSVVSFALLLCTLFYKNKI
jgi:uncharacterized membrane protein